MNLQTLMEFMQQEDPNGSWLEWLDEINNQESTFDKEYVVEVLTNWYNDSGDEKFKRLAEEVKSM